MRPPTPRLRINSEDFMDNDSAGSPSDPYPLYSNSASLSVTNKSSGGKNNFTNTDNNKTYQSSVTNNKPTTTTNNTTTNSHQTNNNPFQHNNANVNSLVDELVADSDPHDFSVL